MLEINKIYLGDNLELLNKLDDNSVHSCVSDFPYNLGFMGKEWDTISNYYDWCYKRAEELLRVLKPGGYALIFGGTRTHHRLVCAFEDAGFQIKDEIQWIYAQGFPKSYNISKGFNKSLNVDLSRQWEGWGTALKPSQEPIMVAQKPIEKNYCHNTQKYGVGGMNIDDCRITYKNDKDFKTVKAKCNFTENSKSIGFGTDNTLYGNGITPLEQARKCVREEGRFPTNVIFDEVSAICLDNQSGIKHSTRHMSYKRKIGDFINKIPSQPEKDWFTSEFGGASRFFYCAKASKKERTENGQVINNHPTVKPISLIKYLVKLVTPPNGICIDICEGSGTHVRAIQELNKEGSNFHYIGFEKDEESYDTACEREKINRIC